MWGFTWAMLHVAGGGGAGGRASTYGRTPRSQQTNPRRIIQSHVYSQAEARCEDWWASVFVPVKTFSTSNQIFQLFTRSQRKWPPPSLQNIVLILKNIVIFQVKK